MIRILSALRFLAWPILIVLAWFTGRRGAKRDAAIKDAQAHIKTRRAMDESDDAMGKLSPDGARRWLYNRGNQR